MANHDPATGLVFFLLLLLVISLNLDAVIGLAASPTRPAKGVPPPTTTTAFFARDSRRTFLANGLQQLAIIISSSSTLTTPSPVNAAITDETDNFGDNWWTKGLDKPPLPAFQQKQSQAAVSDEITVTIPVDDILSAQRAGTGLGLELSEVEFRTNLRVYVKTVRPGSLAFRNQIQPNWVVVAVNGQSTERTNAAGVAQLLAMALKQQQQSNVVELRFRDTTVFQKQLQNLSTADDNTNPTVTTQIAPAGDTTQRLPGTGTVVPGRTVTAQDDQKVTVSQLVAPRLCTRGAETDDLLEISYLGTVVDTGAIFDGSAIRINGQAIPGRGNDVSLFFVLGKQPFGQFPPGWDVGLVGMCVGERRRLIIPPVLAYGSTGQPRRGIPPDATLQYDITLVSINGLAVPR